MVDIIIKDIEEENVELNFLKMLVAIFQVLLGFLELWREICLTLFASEQMCRNTHCVKSVRIRIFSGPYFPVFSPNTGEYGSEKLQIQTLFLQ